MKGKRTTSVLLFLALLLAVASMIFANRMQSAHAQVSQAEQAIRQSARLIAMMRSSSDELTRMARLYAVTGDSRYLAYFNEILDIRNGDAPRPQNYDAADNYWDHVLATGERPGPPGPALPLNSILRGQAFAAADLPVLTDAELDLLQKAENLSNQLVLIELEVIALVDRQIAQGEGSYILTGNAVEGLLRLHDKAYHAAKLDILTPLAELQAASEQRLQAELERRQQRHRQVGNTQVALATISAIVILLAVLLRMREF